MKHFIEKAGPKKNFISRGGNLFFIMIGVFLLAAFFAFRTFGKTTYNLNFEIDSIEKNINEVADIEILKSNNKFESLKGTKISVNSGESVEIKLKLEEGFEAEKNENGKYFLYAQGTENEKAEIDDEGFFKWHINSVNSDTNIKIKSVNLKTLDIAYPQVISSDGKEMNFKDFTSNFKDKINYGEKLEFDLNMKDNFESYKVKQVNAFTASNGKSRQISSEILSDKNNNFHITVYDEQNYFGEIKSPIKSIVILVDKVENKEPRNNVLAADDLSGVSVQTAIVVKDYKMSVSGENINDSSMQVRVCRSQNIDQDGDFTTGVFNSEENRFECDIPERFVEAGQIYFFFECVNKEEYELEDMEIEYTGVGTLTRVEVRTDDTGRKCYVYTLTGETYSNEEMNITVKGMKKKYHVAVSNGSADVISESDFANDLEIYAYTGGKNDFKPIYSNENGNYVLTGDGISKLDFNTEKNTFEIPVLNDMENITFYLRIKDNSFYSKSNGKFKFGDYDSSMLGEELSSDDGQTATFYKFNVGNISEDKTFSITGIEKNIYTVTFKTKENQGSRVNIYPVNSDGIEESTDIRGNTNLSDQFSLEKSAQEKLSSYKIRPTKGYSFHSKSGNEETSVEIVCNNVQGSYKIEKDSLGEYIEISFGDSAEITEDITIYINDVFIKLYAIRFLDENGNTLGKEIIKFQLVGTDSSSDTNLNSGMSINKFDSLSFQYVLGDAYKPIKDTVIINAYNSEDTQRNTPLITNDRASNNFYFTQSLSAGNAYVVKTESNDGSLWETDGDLDIVVSGIENKKFDVSFTCNYSPHSKYLVFEHDGELSYSTAGDNAFKKFEKAAVYGQDFVFRMYLKKDSPYEELDGENINIYFPGVENISAINVQNFDSSAYSSAIEVTVKEIKDNTTFTIYELSSSFRNGTVAFGSEETRKGIEVYFRESDNLENYDNLYDSGNIFYKGLENSNQSLFNLNSSGSKCYQFGVQVANGYQVLPEGKLSFTLNFFGADKNKKDYSIQQNLNYSSDGKYRFGFSFNSLCSDNQTTVKQALREKGSYVELLIDGISIKTYQIIIGESFKENDIKIYNLEKDPNASDDISGKDLEGRTISVNHLGSLRFKVQGNFNYAEEINELEDKIFFMKNSDKSQKSITEVSLLSDGITFKVENITENLTADYVKDKNDTAVLNFITNDSVKYYSYDPGTKEIDEDALSGMWTASGSFHVAVKANNGYDLNTVKKDVKILNGSIQEDYEYCEISTEGQVSGYVIYDIYNLGSAEINVSFVAEKNEYTISLISSATVSSSGNSQESTTTVTYQSGEENKNVNEIKVKHGESAEFSVILEEKCNNSDLKVNLYDNNDNYIETLNSNSGKYKIVYVEKNMKVKVENLTLNRYILNFSKSEQAEFISESSKTLEGTVEVIYGESYSFKVNAKPGYSLGNNFAVQSVSSSGVSSTLSKDSSGNYTIKNIKEGYKISVENVDSLVYTIDFKPVDGVTYLSGDGFVISGKTKINYMNNYEFSINIDDAYSDSLQGAYIIVNNGNQSNTKVQKLANGRYLIQNVTQDVTIQVGNVNKNKYNVTLTKNEGIEFYSLSGKMITGENEVEHGSNFYFRVKLYTAYEGSAIKVMLGNKEISPNAENFYTVENVQEGKTVTVTGIEKSKVANLIDNINSLPQDISNDEDFEKIIKATRDYNSLEEYQKSQVSNYYMLENLHEKVANINHTYNGVTAEGLDWYIKVIANPIVSDMDACERIYKKLNSEYIVSLYDVYLWDVINDCRYKLSGETPVVIHVPTPDMSYFENPTGIHEGSSGKIDYLNLNMKGGITSFETFSLSPVGIVANRSLQKGRSSLIDAIDANISMLTDYEFTPLSSSGSSGSSNSSSNKNSSSGNNMNSFNDESEENEVESKYVDKSRTPLGSALKLVLILTSLAVIGVIIFVFAKKYKEMKENKNK